MQETLLQIFHCNGSVILAERKWAFAGIDIGISWHSSRIWPILDIAILDIEDSSKIRMEIYFEHLDLVS